MSAPNFLSVVKNILLSDFVSTPKVTLKIQQPTNGRNYYRLKCTADPTYSPGFPTTYLYLGSQITSPNWYYTIEFSVTSVKNSSLVDTSFQTLFTAFSSRDSFRVTAELQSSTSSTFSSYETASQNHLLDISLEQDQFGPTWTVPTWVDAKYSIPGVATLTHSDQKGVKGISRIDFTFSQATARYGTSIKSYTIIIDGGFSKTYTSFPSTISLDLEAYYNIVGNIGVTFIVEDTRGQSTSFKRTLVIVPYTALYLTTNDTHRQGGTGSTVILDFTGYWQGDPLTLTCTGIVAKEEGSSTAHATLIPVLSIAGSSFSYRDTWSGVTFDSKKAYTLEATFTDTVKTVTITMPIPVGTPVMSIRNQKVGVNNPSPSFTLDVSGLIGQNGQAIMGFVKELTDETSSNSVDLNRYKTAGYYVYKTLVQDVYNFPDTTSANRACIVEVVGFDNYIIQKLFYLSTAETHIRTFTTYGWTQWKKVTMT